MRVQLRELFVGPRQRKDYGQDEMAMLSRDLDENGQITAITVRPPNPEDRESEDYDGEPWVLVAGGRRVMAAAMLGWESLEGYAREEMSELTHRVLELHENLKRKDMTWQEQVDAKSEIVRLRRMENPNITNAEIAKELGESSATFSRDLATAEVIKENPGLRKATSKHTALSAGKVLQGHKERETRAGVAAEQESPAGPLEERIVTADAVTYVRELPEDSIDLALLDGPYGYNFWKLGQKQAKGETHLSQYDDSPETVGILYRNLMPELQRALRPTGWLVMFCGMETWIFLSEQAKALGLHPEPFPWIWYRPNSRNQPRHPHLHAKNMAELIFVCNMGKATILKTPAPSVLVHDADYGTARVHANEKPIPLYVELVERLTHAGDSVLDCFYGSGNSLAAAASKGRVPYGCDSNPEVLPYALGRIRQHQTVLTATDITASLERYKKRLADPAAVFTPLEVEELPSELGLIGDPKLGSILRPPPETTT